MPCFADVHIHVCPLYILLNFLFHAAVTPNIPNQPRDYFHANPKQKWGLIHISTQEKLALIVMREHYSGKLENESKLTDTTQLMSPQAGIYTQISGMPTLALILLHCCLFSKSQLHLNFPDCLTVAFSGIEIGSWGAILIWDIYSLPDFSQAAVSKHLCLFAVSPYPQQLSHQIYLFLIQRYFCISVLVRCSLAEEIKLCVQLKDVDDKLVRIKATLSFSLPRSFLEQKSEWIEPSLRAPPAGHLWKEKEPTSVLRLHLFVRVHASTKGQIVWHSVCFGQDHHLLPLPSPLPSQAFHPTRFGDNKD